MKPPRHNYDSAFRVFSSLSVLTVFSVLPLLAQTIPAEGRVVRPDSTPVAGVRVVLHRVGQVLQGPVDSTNTDSRGRFRLRFIADTSAIYLLSARYSGIEYFSPPVHTNPARPDTSRPTWVGALPRGTMGLELGESDVSPEAVGRGGDSLIVTAAIAPGEKQLTLEYLVPAGRQVLELPLTEAVPMLNVLAEESEVVVSGGTLVFADSQ